MSTRIQIKRGTTTPSGLTTGEFAYNVTNSTLYIGNTADQKWIGGEVTGGVDMGGGSAPSQNRVPTQNAVYQYARNNFVQRLNGISGGITLNAGANITITSSVAGGITIASSDTVGVTAGDAVTWTQLQRFPAGISAHGATLSGTVTAPTQAIGTNNTTVATTAFVQSEIVADTVTSFNGRTGAVQGVSAAVAGNGISVSGATGAVTITNTGVTRAVAGTGISVSANTGTVTITNIGVQSFNGSTGAVTGVSRFNGYTGGVTLSAGIGMEFTQTANGITVSNAWGPIDDSLIDDDKVIAYDGTAQTHYYSTVGNLLGNYVTTVNGATGAITNVARTNTANTFSGLQTSASGFSGPLTGAVTGSLTGTATNASSLGGTAAASWALLASPTFTGTPAAPTPTAGTNTTQIATTAFVRTEITNLVDSAPGTLDTLNELAAALGDDPNFATTITTALSNKAGTTGGGASGTWGISITGNAGTATTSSQLGGTAASSWALLASPTFTGTPAAPTPAVGTNSTQIATTAFVQNEIVADTVTSFNGRTGAVQGVSAAVAGNGISVSGATGSVTITNTGVTRAVAGTGISVSANTGTVTITNSGALLTANTFTGLQTFTAGISADGGITLNGAVTGATATFNRRVNALQGICVGSGYNVTSPLVVTNIISPLSPSGGATLTIASPGDGGPTRLALQYDDGVNPITHGTFVTNTFTANRSYTLPDDSGTLALTKNVVSSFNGVAGAVQGVSAAVAGNGISVSGATGAVTITNTGVTRAIAGTGIGLNANTGTVTITNNGVVSFNGSTGVIQGVGSIVAGSNVTISPTGGTGAVTINATVPTVNNGTLTLNTSGNGITGSQTFTANQSSAATFTVTSNATDANTASTIVFRNASGNFSAGTITASLTGTASNASALGNTAASGWAQLAAANTFSGLQTSASGFSGPLTGSVTGNASTATALQTARGFSLSGDVNASVVNFDGTGSVTLATAIAAGVIVDADINAAANIAVTKLAANKISGITLGNNLNTLTIGTGLGGGSYNGSSAVTITNNGVQSFNGSTGAIQGVGSIVAGTNVTISPIGGTGAVTINSVGVTSTAAYTWSAAQTFNGGVTASTLDVTGNTRLNGNVNLGNDSSDVITSAGGATFSRTIDVTGVARFNAGATASTLDVTGTSRFAGLASFPSGLSGAQARLTSIAGNGTLPTAIDPPSGSIASEGSIRFSSSIGIPIRYNTLATAQLSADQTITLPDESGTVALRGANTFTGLQTLTAGLSAAGGITLNGTVAGATATFSRLLTANAGISASGITLPGNSSINFTTSDGYIDASSGYLRLGQNSNRVYIGDVNATGNSTFIFIRDAGSSLDISNPNGQLRLGDYANVNTGMSIVIDNSGNDIITINGDIDQTGGINSTGRVTGQSGVAIGADAISAKTSGYTLTAGDNGKVVTFNSASALVCGVDTAAGATGFSCTVIQLGTGGVRFASSGVTLNSYNGLTLAGQHAAASLVCYQTNVLNVSGNLVS